MKLNKKSPSFLAAIACMQIFSAPPQAVSVGEADNSYQQWQGTEIDMPNALAKEMTPLIAQGFFVMSWEVTPARTGYFVDLYHSNPARLNSQKDDIRSAAARGLGISVRKFIRISGRM